MSLRLIWASIGVVILAAGLLAIVLGAAAFILPPRVFWVIVAVAVIVTAVQLMRMIPRATARYGLVCPSCGSDISRIYYHEKRPRPNAPDPALCERCGVKVIDPLG